MTTIKIDPLQETLRGTVDTSKDGVFLDNNKPGRADALAPIEEGCAFLTGTRKVSAGGVARLYAQAADSEWNFKIPREPYSKNLRVEFLVALTGATSDDYFLTINVSTTSNPTGVEAVIHNQLSTSVDDAAEVTLVVQFGDGTKNSMGEEEVDITFTRSNDGTVRVWNIEFEPLPMHSLVV